MSRYELTDRFLWLLVPVALAASYYAAQNLLSDVKVVTAVPIVEESVAPKKVDDDAENHIPPDALRVISDGHSFELRKAAFKIALSQSLKPDAKRILLRDLASKDWERRDSAVFALWYLVYGPDLHDDEYISTRFLHQSELQQFATYSSIITALVNLLPLHVQSEALQASDLPPSPVKPLRRPTHEGTLILVLLELIRAFNRNPAPEGGVHTALEAGLVQGWISRYPFPCTLPQFSKLQFRRSDVNDLLHHDCNYSRDDYLMAELFRQIQSSPTGRTELRAVGLARRHSRLREDFIRENSADMAIGKGNQSGNRAANNASNNNDSNNTNNDDERSETSAWRSFHPPVRSRSGFDLTRPEDSDLTEEEYQQRRRNREAVVMIDPADSTGLSAWVPATSRAVAGPSGDSSNERPRRVAASSTTQTTQAAAATNDDTDAASSLSFSSVGSSGNREEETEAGGAGEGEETRGVEQEQEREEEEGQEAEREDG